MNNSSAYQTDKLPPDPKKKTPKFRKTDFAIQSRKVDTFAQIDSFKLTAKKDPGPTQNATATAHPGYQQFGAHQGVYPGFVPQQQIGIPFSQQPYNMNTILPGGTHQTVPAQPLPSYHSTATAVPNGGFPALNANVAMSAFATPQSNTGLQNFATSSVSVSSGMMHAQIHPETPCNNTVNINSKSSEADDFGDFTYFPAADNLRSSSHTTDGSQKLNGSENKQEDEFGDFGSFSASTIPSQTSTNEFQEFSSFSDASSVPQSSKEEDNFGAFSGFNELPAASTHITPSVQPHSQSVKRVNVVVRKNAVVTKERTGSFNSRLSASFQSVEKVPIIGQEQLADTLAKASNQLASKAKPPILEDEDFKTLQEAVQTPESRSSPVVKPLGAFTLPDTPTRINKIFPKCPPKPSSNNIDDFGDFASVPQFTPQAPTFGVTSSTEIVTEQPNQLTNRLESSESQSDSAKTRSHAVDWSALSALDELRDVETSEGDLGDFSVFGGQVLRPVTDVSTETNLLTSPLHTAANVKDNSTVVENVEDDEWADFNAPMVAPSENSQKFIPNWSSESKPADTDMKSWSAFSSTSDPPVDKVAPQLSTFTSHSQVASETLQLNSDLLTGWTADSNPTQSTPPVLHECLKHNQDDNADNDSDWSDFAVKPNIHEDAISSDWSFKDNTSLHEVTSNADNASGQKIDLFTDSVSRLSLDDKKPVFTALGQSNMFGGSGSNSDWSMPDVIPTISQDEDDDWAAFDSANPARGSKPVSKVNSWASFDNKETDTESKSAVPDAVEADLFAVIPGRKEQSVYNASRSLSAVRTNPTQPSSVLNISSPVNETWSGFSPPPVPSPEKNGSSIFGVFGSPTQELPSPVMHDESSCNPREKDSVGFSQSGNTATTEQVNARAGTIEQDSSATNTNHYLDEDWDAFAPPAVDAPSSLLADSSKVELEIMAKGGSVSSDFGPPPLTEDDFSPTKPTRQQTDWFSYRETDREVISPAMDELPTGQDMPVYSISQSSNEDGSMELVVEVERLSSCTSDLSVKSEVSSERVSGADVVHGEQQGSECANNVKVDAMPDMTECETGAENIQAYCQTQENLNLKKDDGLCDATVRQLVRDDYKNDDSSSDDWGFPLEPPPLDDSADADTEHIEHNLAIDEESFKAQGTADIVDSGAAEDGDDWAFQSSPPPMEADIPDDCDDNDNLSQTGAFEEKTKHSDLSVDDWGFQSGNTSDAIGDHESGDIPEEKTTAEDREHNWGSTSPSAATTDVLSSESYDVESFKSKDVAADDIILAEDNGTEAWNFKSAETGANSDNDWGFKAFDNDDEDNDDWTFKDTPTEPFNEDEDDWTFKGTEDLSDDEFQDFNSEPVQPLQQVQTVQPALLQAPSTQVLKGKVISLLFQTFQEKSRPSNSPVPDIALTDKLSGSNVWDSLTDLNKKSFLQWSDSCCYNGLITSLHIPKHISCAGTFGSTAQSGGLLMPSPMLTTLTPSVPPQRVIIQHNSNNAMKVKSQQVVSKTEQGSLDLDFFDSLGASNQATSKPLSNKHSSSFDEFLMDMSKSES